jgi:hypothetical protein
MIRQYTVQIPDSPWDDGQTEAMTRFERALVILEANGLLLRSEEVEDENIDNSSERSDDGLSR